MLKVWWEMSPTFNVAKSKATWLKFHKIMLIILQCVHEKQPPKYNAMVFKVLGKHQ